MINFVWSNGLLSDCHQAKKWHKDNQDLDNIYHHLLRLMELIVLVQLVHCLLEDTL